MDGGRYAFVTEEKRRSNCKRKALYVLAVVVVGGAVGTLLFFLLYGTSVSGKSEGSCPIDVPDIEKFDCHPDRPVSEAECLKRGCCYKPASDLTVEDFDLIESRYLGVPSCYYSSKFVGYEVGNVSSTADGVTATLSRKIPSGFAKDIQKVNLEVSFIDDGTLRIKVRGPSNAMFL